MSRKQIELLSNEIITEEQLEAIYFNEEVANVENLGQSSSHRGYDWIDIRFLDGFSIDVFA